MNSKNRIISFRMNNKELEMFNNRVKESGLSKTEYIITSCLGEKPVPESSVISKSCAIKREVDLLLAKLTYGGGITSADFDGIKKELEREWK